MAPDWFLRSLGIKNTAAAVKNHSFHSRSHDLYDNFAGQFSAYGNALLLNADNNGIVKLF